MTKLTTINAHYRNARFETQFVAGRDVVEAELAGVDKFEADLDTLRLRVCGVIFRAFETLVKGADITDEEGGELSRAFLWLACRGEDGDAMRELASVGGHTLEFAILDHDQGGRKFHLVTYRSDLGGQELH